MNSDIKLTATESKLSNTSDVAKKTEITTQNNKKIKFY